MLEHTASSLEGNDLEFRTKDTILFLVLTYVLLNCYYCNYIIIYICINLQILCIENLKLCVWNTSCIILFLWRCDPTRVMAFSLSKLLDHAQRRTTVGRTPLDEWSARRRDLYLTTHNIHNRQHVHAPGGFQPTILAGERPQTYTLDGAATGTSTSCI